MKTYAYEGKEYKNLKGVLTAISKLKGPDFLKDYYNSNIVGTELQPRCIITGKVLPYERYREFGKFYNTAIKNLFSKCGKDISLAKEKVKEYIYIEELDMFHLTWKGCSTSLAKTNISKEIIYNKYYFPISKCILPRCNDNVPFSLVRKNACCILHANQFWQNHADEDLKYECVIDGNRFIDVDNLTKHIKRIGVDPEEYFNKHVRKNDTEGVCKWCGKPTTFKNPVVGYCNFCHNSDCNVNWYNKHENRASDCGHKISATHKTGVILPSQVGYWMKKGFTELKSKELVVERQTTNSVENIRKIHNCSLKEANQIRANITDKWLKSFPRLNYSMISQELFWAVYEQIKDSYKSIHFATLINGEKDNSGKNHEYRVKTHRSSRKLDFYIKDINKMIEFDGTYWHNVRNKDKQLRDEVREQEIIDILRCDILHVKEADYMKNKVQVIQNCIEFLNS